MKIVTIGAYGFSEEAFFNRLVATQVDTFCDIRRRRGMRGREYAFANSSRLQSRLAELGIRYVHIKELAPTESVREAQQLADRAGGATKRGRVALSPSFIEAYERECLRSFDFARFESHLPNSAQVVAFFCVERAPAACHRSLVAERLAEERGYEVEHLM